MDLTTVADDFVEFHDGLTVLRHDGLEPDTTYEFHDVIVHTLPRPGGALLSVFATANDVHFGETDCGVIGGVDAGPVMRAEPGEEPYPVVMNRSVIADIAAIAPAIVVVKGDLTGDGTDEEYADFLAWYGGAFGDRLVHVRGNHDAYHGQTYAAGPQRIDLPGITLAVLDTVIPFETTGRIDADQLEWLDALCAQADRPVLVFGHHNLWMPGSPNGAAHRSENYFGVNPDSSEALLALALRRRRLCGYFAGHTHRNRVRHWGPTGTVPYAEVACVKDFPGSWAEYRAYEGGILQIHHRASAPDALAWSERCRQIYNKVMDYSAYALGELHDRCYVIATDRS
jgi:Icc protein